MKKIKYGNRKNQQENNTLANLKEDDQICEAVLDTLSDQYLNYISHLVKHSKTPLKQNPTKDREQTSSDSQAACQPNPNSFHPPSLLNSRKQQSKNRHHSQTGPKRTHPPLPKQPPLKNFLKDYCDQPSRRLSFQKDKQTIAKQKPLCQKRRKKKMQYQMNEDLLKNQQKTMSFTRNKNPFEFKEKEYRHKENQLQQKYKNINKIMPKCYTHYQELEESSNQRPSIQQHLRFHTGQSQRDNTYPFINQIDNYISHLESSPPERPSRYSLKKNKEKNLKDNSYFPRKKPKIQQEQYSQYDVEELLKQNLKQQKKIKSYEQKIEQLEDEVSSHLIQCKQRDKHYKNKIADLIKTLTHSLNKINQQKTQIHNLQLLLKTVGQKAKQIQNQNTSSDELQDNISESIVKYLGSQKQEHKTKYKKGLESTLPKHEQDKKYWRE